MHIGRYRYLLFVNYCRRFDWYLGCINKPKLCNISLDDLVEKAEKLGNEGKVEEAQGVMKLCEQLRKERYHLEGLSNDRQDHISQAKQMEVCPVCGAFLIVGDAESRQREHLMGKQHMGYAQVMTTYGLCAGNVWHTLR